MTPRKTSGTVNSKKRSRTILQTDEEAEIACVEAGPSTQAAKTRKKQKKNEGVPPWSDIPHWTSNRSPLMDMPLEIWDKVRLYVTCHLESLDLASAPEDL